MHRFDDEAFHDVTRVRNAYLSARSRQHGFISRVAVTWLRNQNNEHALCLQQLCRLISVGQILA